MAAGDWLRSQQTLGLSSNFMSNKNLCVRVVLIWCLFSVSIFLPACKSVLPVVRQPIDAKPLFEAQDGKDRSVIDWADRIDSRVDSWFALFPSPIAGEIKAATASQRESVRKAPASQFNVIIDAYKRNAVEDAKVIAMLRNEVVKANDRFFFWMRAILIGGGSLIMAASVFGFFALSSITTAFPLIGKNVIGGIAMSGSALFVIGFAYEWAYKNQGWAIGGVAVIITFIGTGIYFNRLHDKAERN